MLKFVSRGVCLAGPICLGFMGLPSTAAAQTTFFAGIAKAEAKIQSVKPEFYFVDKPTVFEPRLNATRPLTITSYPVGAQATLHDEQSGRPLETCQTPCTLYGRTNLTYALTLYKKGHWPQVVLLDVNDWIERPKKIDLGFNLDNIIKDRKRCFAANKRLPLSDGDAAPCARMPPQMPQNAKRSGHCTVHFDIGRNGIPFNIKASQCSDDIFKEASEFAIKWWVYKPKIDRGIAVDRLGVRSKMTFHLEDEDGNIIPER